MSAYVQSINSIAAQRLAESLNKTAEKNDNSFSAVFQSALNLLEETNNLQHNAEAQELNLTLNYLENPHDVTDALTKRRQERNLSRKMWTHLLTGFLSYMQERM